MSKAVKGLLLSGLVLPGLGQMTLKSHIRGVIFMLAAIGGLIVLLVKATGTAMNIVEQTTPAINSLDVDQMFAAANQAVAQADTGGLSLAMVVILVAWIGSTVDAFFLGRRLDREARIRPQDAGGETDGR